MYQLGLFAKYWQPGKVKTRLARGVGEIAACRIYRIFLEHLVSEVPSSLDNRWIVFSPADRLDDFRAMADTVLKGNPDATSMQFIPQSDGDLGMRMSQFFEQAFDADADSPVASRKVIVIGSDTPTLSPGQILQADQLLDESQVVLGPSTDGGYYFIAMRDGENRKELMQIFNGIEWSTPEVLQQTYDVLEARNIKYSVSHPMTDVDELEDLLNLVQQLGESDLPADKQLLSRLKELNTDKECGGFLG